mgnify:CR=1 FL=1
MNKQLFLFFVLTFNIDAFDSEPLVSMHLQQARVESVLTSLAELKGLNLIINEQVPGLVNVEFEQVPWSRALTILLQMQGLEYAIEHNVLLVAPLGKLTEYQLKQFELQNKLEQTQQLISTLIPIKFAKAKDLATTLKSSNDAILSARGQVSFDERTNTLIVRDTTRAIDNILPVIEKLDVKVQQVLIEARMVTLRDNLDQQFGIQWGVTDVSSSNSSGVSGSLNGISTFDSGQSNNASYLDRLNVNLPVVEPAGRIALKIAKLADGSLLDLELSVLERESKGEIIASPRILATNQNTSKIEQGTEIPYLQAAAHGATSVAFKKAVLSLEVTPLITPTGGIVLDLNITQDARGDTVITSTGPAVAIDTQQIKTQVSVKDGETLVLGGIYQQQMVKSVTKVPWLADLPYIGWLFKADTSYNEKRQLLVFVTPTIIKD